ncbi:MAG: DUF6067 family protein, partial [Candidatus Omnitrophica bacterium]|nr:DUF6067 family protein [Candidatus Omnitrophota bacterium]
MTGKIILLMVFLSLAVNLQAENKITIYWTDTPPVIDAKEDDACWRLAERAKNFTLFKKAGQPTQQTEVAACYDADCLYFFWKLYDATPNKIVFGNPEDVRDFITWKDVAELFLDPGQTKKDYYQFAATPSGARFDLSSKKSTGFNPEWQVKGAVYDWGWALEMAIPFTELAHANEFFGTPAVGDIWGINFCRDQGSLHEWSQWEPSMMSFHQVQHFGTAIFAGRKDGRKLPMIKNVFFEQLFFGPGSFSFQITSDAPVLTCTYLLTRDNQPVLTREGEKVAPGQIQIPYRITRSGTWRASISFYQEKQKIYTGSSYSSLPPVTETLRDIKKKLDQAKTQFKSFSHLYRSTLEKKVTELGKSLAESLALVQQSENLSREEWKKLTDSLAAAGHNWKNLDFDLSLVRLYPKGKQASFTVVPASPNLKVYRDSVLVPEARPIKLALAGNEYESFQLVLVPFWRDIKDIRVTFSDLAGPRKISKNNFFPFRVEYVKLKNVDPEDTRMREYEPDILFPATSFSLEAGKLQPVWIDFYLPADTPAGTYRGQVSFSAGKQRYSWPIEVTSYGFNLPRKS